MFAFPVVGSLTSPVILNGVALSFSFGGALIAWTLVAALVGSLLGLLRDATNPRSQATPRTTSDGAHLDTDHAHQEAA